MPIDDMRIDKAILLPLAIRAAVRLKCDPSKWNDYEIQQITLQCAGVNPAWAAMPLQNVRAQCENLRKAGKLPKHRKDNNHGATKREQPPEKYLDYIANDPHWKQFRLEVLEWWDHSCALCNGKHKLDVHHRTYRRLGAERMNDVIALCRRCHTMADRSRQRQVKIDKATMLF